MINDVSADRLIELLAEKKNTVILYHIRSDADAVGSAFALRLLLEAKGSRAYCVCGDEIPSRLRFLTDGIQESALPESLPEDFVPERVIAVDSGSLSQLGSAAEKFVPELTIDHHGTSSRFCDGYVDPDSAATAEIIFDIAEKMDLFPAGFAERVYAGISSDTGCFKYSNVTPATHLRAAKLLSLGIDAADINHRLFDSKTASELKAAAVAAEHLRTYHGGAICVAVLPASLLGTLDVSREDYDIFIETARTLRGVKIAAAVRRAPGDHGCRVSMRAACDFDVSKVCAVFGGGGHARAAGCTVDTDDEEEAARLIVAEIERRLV